MKLEYRHVEQGAALLFALVGAYCVYAGSTLKYYDLLGPGPGFFPIWIGVLLTVLSLTLLIFNRRHRVAQDEVGFRRSDPADALKSEADAVGSSITQPGDAFFTDTGAVTRLLGLFAALTMVWWTLDLFGFRLCLFVFTLLAPRIIDRQPWYRSLAVALGCSFGVAYVFEHWLGVQLPRSSLDVLSELGW